MFSVPNKMAYQFSFASAPDLHTFGGTTGEFISNSSDGTGDTTTTEVTLSKKSLKLVPKTTAQESHTTTTTTQVQHHHHHPHYKHQQLLFCMPNSPGPVLNFSKNTIDDFGSLSFVKSFDWTGILVFEVPPKHGVYNIAVRYYNSCGRQCEVFEGLGHTFYFTLPDVCPCTKVKLRIMPH